MQTLLLADADPVSRCVLDVHLRKEGYNVTVAADSAEAIEAIEKANSGLPDIVVADTQLPGIDGFELVRRIRAKGALDEPAVVFLTTHGSLEDRRRALDLGVEDCLTKPVYLRELSSRIQFLLAKRARRAIDDRALSNGDLGRLAGSTRDLALIDIIRSFEASRRSGVVRLRNGMHEAHIFFRDGNVVDADLGPLRAEAAVHRALLWDEASFEVELRPVSNEDTIGRSSQALVLAGVRRMDEWVRLCAQVKPLAALLDVRPPQLLDRLNDLTEIPEGLRALVSPSPWSESRPALTSSPVPPKSDGDSTSVEPHAARPRPMPTAAPASATSAASPSEREASAPPPPQRIPSQRPSAAPWTREVDPTPDLVGDAIAAGVPRAIGATTKRVAATGAALALVLGAVVGLRSVRARQLQEADEARGAAATAVTTTANNVVEPPLPPAVPIVPVEPAPAGAASVAEPSGGSPPVGAGLIQSTPTAANASVVTMPIGESRVPTQVGDPRAKAQERVLDVKFQFHSLSPLVRDAQRALLKGDPDTATALAQRATSEAPADADGWLTLAAARKDSGDLAGAGDAYRRCIAEAQTAGVMNCRVLATKY